MRLTAHEQERHHPESIVLLTARILEGTVPVDGEIAEARPATELPRAQRYFPL
ncbi:hypothetical protein OHT57_05600 [Streptomyces sp. NBC_00285]|uniref:hypothetical protein n=1 Tax=Streptomyces sp. NBC_00285 TaxID=2975700 RepID=UPI002E2B6B5E|nr:hypothetical protein [Streptomyces sp. NBC_00285]